MRVLRNWSHGKEMERDFPRLHRLVEGIMDRAGGISLVKLHHYRRIMTSCWPTSDLLEGTITELARNRNDIRYILKLYHEGCWYGDYDEQIRKNAGYVLGRLHVSKR